MEKNGSIPCSCPRCRCYNLWCLGNEASEAGGGNYSAQTAPNSPAIMTGPRQNSLFQKLHYIRITCRASPLLPPPQSPYNHHHRPTTTNTPIVLLLFGYNFCWPPHPISALCKLNRWWNYTQSINNSLHRLSALHHATSIREKGRSLVAALQSKLVFNWLMDIFIFRLLRCIYFSCYPFRLDFQIIHAFVYSSFRNMREYSV